MNAPPLIPWSTPDQWAEANAGLAHLVRHHRSRLDEARRYAHELQARMRSLFPLMDRLCAAACPACTDICCRRACVWIDFRDLLFLHLAGITAPEGQLLSRRGERCRYHTAAGCRLERIQRPFVCIWYLCPVQTGYLRRKSGSIQHTTACLQQIKQLRKEMENVFIRATC
jgi:hypothetical protein